MIKGITSGPGITIDNNLFAGPPYFNMNTPSAGMLRYNGGSQLFEVYDGYSWTAMYTAHPTISLSPDAQLTLEWARKK